MQLSVNLLQVSSIAINFRKIKEDLLDGSHDFYFSSQVVSRDEWIPTVLAMLFTSIHRSSLRDDLANGYA
jgi:hypothetical protein